MSIQYHIDHINRNSDQLTIEGWAVNDQNLNKEIHFRIRKDRHSVPFEMQETDRPDVSRALFPGKTLRRKTGFQIKVPLPENDSCELLLHSGFNNTVRISLTPKEVRNMAVREEQYRIAMEEEILKKHPDQKGVSYGLWRKLNTLSDEEIHLQKQRKWDESSPLFSIVIPLYETPHGAFRELLLSVMHQTYEKWELCLADGSHDDSLRQVILEICGDDPRIHYQHLSENKGISENTNAAIRMASGDYVVFCDHDDLLAVNALYEMADAIIKDPDADYLYSDSDNTNEDTSLFYNVYFKPDYDPDLLSSVNYINHLSVIRRSFLNQTGYLRSEYDGAQDHDLVLRASEESDHFVHVPKVLYHWRATEGSTAAGMDEKSYASVAGRKAVYDHWQRKYPDISVDRVDQNPVNGSYHTIFAFSEEPLVSVILTGKDTEESRKSIEKGTWKNLEFTDNPGKAKGKYLLFVRSSAQMNKADAVTEMTGYAQRKDTGVIGTEIFREDGTIVSTGILMGIHGSYANAFAGQNPEKQNIYFSRDGEVQDVSAVSDIAFMIRKDLFVSMNGFDETFEAEGKVIDLCLRCMKKGYRNIYNPYASFVTTEDRIDFKDQKKILDKYPEIQGMTDPYFNINFSPDRTDFECRNPQREPYDKISGNKGLS